MDLLREGVKYGMALIGDGATIKKAPLFNILASSPSRPVMVLDIVDKTQSLVEGKRSLAGNFDEIW